MNRSFFFLLIFLNFSFFGFSSGIENSVVRVAVSSQRYNYASAWKSEDLNRGHGTGFAIAGNRIMTNAHVVSDARYIEISRVGDDQLYQAKVSFVAHDCDLAILDIVAEDRDLFFKSITPLDIGEELPELNSVVQTYGYPLGGSQVSVTQGVVSRINSWTYSHSGVDSHLVIQTDAAINPGNSGGPAVQDGKVVGVAFQGIRGADNIGYLIPLSIIRHFLEDIKDGQLNGFGELGIQVRFDMQNPQARDMVKLPKNESGVLVTRVYPNMPAYGLLKPMDVILHIGQSSIRNDGNIILEGKEMIFQEVLERMQEGDFIKLSVWRDGKMQELSLPLKVWHFPIAHAQSYDTPPRYFFFGGLCFTPFSNSYLQDSKGWSKLSVPARRLYADAHTDEAYQDYTDFPVLCQLLNQDGDDGLSDFVGELVESVDGKKVHSLQELYDFLNTDTKPFVEIRFYGKNLPLVLERAQAKASQKSLLKRYHITKDRRL